MLRVGGGFDKLEEHLPSWSRKESNIKYKGLMTNKKMTFLQAIEHYLGQPTATKAFMSKLRGDKTGVYHQQKLFLAAYDALKSAPTSKSAPNKTKSVARRKK